MGTYVYGIVRASHSPLPQDLEGIGEPPRPVRVMRQGELAAIVSDAPEELRPKRRDLLATCGCWTRPQRRARCCRCGSAVSPWTTTR